MSTREQAAAETAWKNAKKLEISSADKNLSPATVDNLVEKAWLDEKKATRAADERKRIKKQIVYNLALAQMNYANGRLSLAGLKTIRRSYADSPSELYKELYKEIQQQTKVQEEEYKAKKEIEVLKEMIKSAQL